MYNRLVITHLKIQYRFCPSCAIRLQNKCIDGVERLACPACDFIFWNNPKPTTSIILLKEGKLLLLKRAHEPFKGQWVLPGGYVEHDEDPKTTIIRETKEETGLDIAVLGVIYTYLIDNDPRGNSIDIVFKGKITGGEVKLREHTNVDFFSPSALPELIAYRHREVITVWNKQ